METHPEPHLPDLVAQLPRDAFYQTVHTLRATMPPIRDTPEDRVRRDNAAIARVAALLPANADEADLAARYVAAGVHAMQCMWLAVKYRGSAELVAKCSAQASSMMRQERATRALLMRVQAERQKREKDNAANDRVTEAEHRVIGQMAQAIAEVPRIAKPDGATVDVAAEADRYAITHRKRAALIRTLGRLPDKLDFGPMSPELVRAIVTGTSAVLRALDSKSQQPERIAA